MATRQVTTVFAVEGERDYKQAIKNINAEIKVLDSELDLLSERYRDNEGSVHGLRQKMSELQEIYDKQNEKLDILVQAYDAAMRNIEKYRTECDRLKETITENRKQLELFAEAGEGSSDAAKTLAKETAELEKSLNNNASHMQTSMRNAADFATQANETRIEIEKLGREIDNTSVYLAEAEASADGYAHSLDRTAESAGEMGDKLKSSVDTIASAMAAAGIERAFDSIRDSMEECRSKALEFETAVTGVFKTVSGSSEQLAKIEQGIKDLALEIPATTTEIASVAEAAGQLGIATDDILEFTEVMIKLGTSTNLSATDAATQLAKFANITGIAAEDYERLGSAIVDLGNKNATQESNIIEFATRMASSADLVGMSATDILAYSTALHSTGIEAEAGGTAISKLFKKIETATALYETAKRAISETGTDIRTLELLAGNQSKEFKSVADSIGLTSSELSAYMKNVRDLENYSITAAMSPEEFIAEWQEAPALALNAFIEGLGEAEKKGGNVILTLSDMGLTEVRLSNAIQNLAADSKRLNKIFEQSNEAWEKNTALADEAAKRYETDASKAVILQNAIEQLEIAIGDDFNNTLEPAIENLTKLTIKMSDAAEESPSFSASLAGVAGAVAGLTGLTAVAAGIKAVSTALSVFGTAAGPVGLTVTAITAAASAFMVYRANILELSDAADEVVAQNDRILESVDKSKSAYEISNESIDLNRDKVEQLTEKIFKLTEEMGQTPAAQVIVQGAVDELNEILPGLGLTYDTVTGQINMTRDALVEFAEQAADTARLDALKKYMQELTGQSIDLEIQSDITSEQIAEAEGRYMAAAKAVEDFTAEQTWLEKVLNWTSPQFLELYEAMKQAENEVDELTQSQSDIAEALQNVNNELENTKTVYENYIASIEQTAEDAKKAGENVSAGFAEGILEAEDDVVSAAKKVASSAEMALKNGLEIRSPSRLAKRIGGYFGEGFADGITESEDMVISSLNHFVGQINISDELEKQLRESQAMISSFGNIKADGSRMDYSEYTQALREMNRAAIGSVAYASGMRESERMANITVIQQLDGKVISREVSRVQWNDTKITARARGIR